MSMMETAAQGLIKLAKSKAQTISQITNRSPEQVKSALAQGEKLLPSIFQNVNNAESGGKFLDSMGIDKSILDKGFNKYSSYFSKIPGMNSSMAKPVIDMIKESMHGGHRTQPKQKPNISFDKNKYPKI